MELELLPIRIRQNDANPTRPRIRIHTTSPSFKVEAARQEALYWALRREALVADMTAKGQAVSQRFKTMSSVESCPLMSGALAKEIDQDLGDR